MRVAPDGSSYNNRRKRAHGAHRATEAIHAQARRTTGLIPGNAREGSAPRARSGTGRAEFCRGIGAASPARAEQSGQGVPLRLADWLPARRGDQRDPGGGGRPDRRLQQHRELPCGIPGAPRHGGHRYAGATTAILRDDREVESPVAELVPGDVIRLNAGDLAPADARLADARDLRVRESALAGELRAGRRNIAAAIDGSSPGGGDLPEAERRWIPHARRGGPHGGAAGCLCVPGRTGDDVGRICGVPRSGQGGDCRGAPGAEGQQRGSRCGLPTDRIVADDEVDHMDDAAPAVPAEHGAVFARVAPEQKNRSAWWPSRSAAPRCWARPPLTGRR